MAWIDNFIKPSSVIGIEIAEKKSDKLTAKPDQINILDEKARKVIEQHLKNSNWELQKSQIIYKKSINGGVCIFNTKINDEWKTYNTENVVFVRKDASGVSKLITLYVDLFTGNTGKYYLYETHDNDNGKIIRQAFSVRDDKSTPQTGFQGQETPWENFLIDTGLILTKEVITKTPTAFLLQNTERDNDGIWGKTDSLIAEREIQILDEAYKSLLYTLRFARTRMIVRKSMGTKFNLIGDDDATNTIEVEGDELLYGGMIEITDSSEYETSNPLSVFDPNPETIRNAWSSFLKADENVKTRVGLANPDDTDSAQKTSLEVSQIRDSEFSAMERDLSKIQWVLSRILESLGVLYDIDLGDEYSWEFDRLDVRNETEKLNDLKTMKEMGWATDDWLIAQARNIPIWAARLEQKKIEKQQKKKQKEAIEQNPPQPQQQDEEPKKGLFGKKKTPTTATIVPEEGEDNA